MDKGMEYIVLYITVTISVIIDSKHSEQFYAQILIIYSNLFYSTHKLG